MKIIPDLGYLADLVAIELHHIGIVRCHRFLSGFSGATFSGRLTRRAFRRCWPTKPRWTVCCYCVNGDMKHAQSTADRYRAIKRTSSLDFKANTHPFKHETDLQRLEAALENAGILVH